MSVYHTPALTYRFGWFKLCGWNYMRGLGKLLISTLKPHASVVVKTTSANTETLSRLETIDIKIRPRHLALRPRQDCVFLFSN